MRRTRPDRAPIDRDAVGERAGWRCAICGGAVDRNVVPDAPSAPSVDHVLPRAHGGSNDPSNLRLAHRRCNARRGSSIPELRWPADLGILQPAPLLPATRRALRNRGRAEIVGVLPSLERAECAARWLADAVTLVMGSDWDVRTTPMPGTALFAIELRAVAAPK